MNWDGFTCSRALRNNNEFRCGMIGGGRAGVLPLTTTHHLRQNETGDESGRRRRVTLGCASLSLVHCSQLQPLPLPLLPPPFASAAFSLFTVRYATRAQV